MFESSSPFLFFDYFRVPYQVTPNGDEQWAASLPERHPLRACGRIGWTASGTSGRALRWPCFEGPHSPLRTLLPAAVHRLDSVPLFGRVLPDELCGPWLGQTGTVWSRSTPIRDTRGNHVASEWRGEDGSTFLPYDPGEVIQNYWSEHYHEVAGPSTAARVKKVAIAGYYRVRPVLPRASQIRLRRMFSRVQARSRFPRWPIETALHDLYARLFRHAAKLAQAPVPWLSLWPNGHSWALVLTHDVETSVGYRDIPVLRDLEVEAGYRSSWNFVPRRYAVDGEVLADLVSDGFEVGVHGLYHDGRDLESLSTLYERLPAIRTHADRWRAAGFRSPATQRVWEWMPLLGFDYDSSYPDTDPFEPQSGGCCSLLPYFNRNMVELPITLPQDHTLFVILGHSDGRVWAEKADHVRSRGGMALIITHPDYASQDGLVDAYKSLLQRFQNDSGAWRALPREVSDWWRRRAVSRLEPTNGGWRVLGPAANQASVVYTSPD
ncbi:MAG: hypothetical protein ACRDZ4_21760 [Egibacteraceae bacterium]